MKMKLEPIGIGIVANALSKVWVILIQLGSIVILTKAWGVDGYGWWTMMSTIPSYVSMADFGVVSAAGTYILIHHAKSEYCLCSDVVHASVRILLFVSLLVAVLSILLRPYLGAAVMWLGLYSCVALFSAIILSIYRATNRYALGTILHDLSFLLEGGSVLVVAAGGGSMDQAAFGMLIFKLASVGFLGGFILNKEAWLRKSWKGDATALKSFLRPAAGSALYSLAEVVNLQAMIVVIGYLYGPVVVASISVIRTITRIPIQCVGIILRATLPNLSRHLAVNEKHEAQKIIIANRIATYLIIVCFIAACATFGGWGVSHLSRGAISPDPRVMFILSAVAVAQIIRLENSQILMAINAQYLFSLRYAVLSVAAVASAFPLRYFGAGVVLLLFMVFVSEALILAFVRKEARHAASVTIGAWR